MRATLVATRDRNSRSASKESVACSHPVPTKWKTSGGSVCPYRSIRPMRCSNLLGLKGMS